MSRVECSIHFNAIHDNGVRLDFRPIHSRAARECRRHESFTCNLNTKMMNFGNKAVFRVQLNAQNAHKQCNGIDNSIASVVAVLLWVSFWFNWEKAKREMQWNTDILIKIPKLNYSGKPCEQSLVQCLYTMQFAYFNMNYDMKSGTNEISLDCNSLDAIAVETVALKIIKWHIKCIVACLFACLLQNRENAIEWENRLFEWL